MIKECSNIVIEEYFVSYRGYNLMKPLLVMFPPTNEFDSGIKTYCKNLEKIYAYDSKVVKNGIVWLNGRIGESPKEKYDFTIIVGYTKQFEEISKIISHFPKPVILVAHDSQLFTYMGDIIDEVDGYIVSMDETKEFIKNYNSKPVLKIRQPFVPNKFSGFDEKIDQIISIGRIVADRGHRHAAELGDFGYKVVIAGSHVKHHEYDEYYKRVSKHHNVIIKPDPTDEELNQLLIKSKVIMSFYYVQEKYPSVYYALLEPISMGCIPVVPYWVAYNCISQGLQVKVVDSSVDAREVIQQLFDNQDEYIRISTINRKIVEHWSDNYAAHVDHFIMENFDHESINC